MTHAPRAQRATPLTATSFAAAALLAVLLAGTVAISSLGPFEFGLPVTDRVEVDQAVIESGRMWELQRRQETGYVDPLIVLGRDWEVQRKQQSGQ